MGEEEDVEELQNRKEKKRSRRKERTTLKIGRAHV